jgi:anti-sigma regulatory factor (Ser/Thr protein kinase)
LIAQTPTQHEHRDGFRHEALLYAGEDEFFAATSSFVRAGLDAGEPTLVVLSQPKIERLRDLVGDAAVGVRFADMTKLGRNPARIIPVWQQFVAAHSAPGVRLRGIGEPVCAGQRDDQLAECQKHESLLNVAFADAGPFWLLCPYDTERLDSGAVDAARRSHPYLLDGEGSHESAAYAAVAEPDGMLAAPPLSDPPVDATEFRFEGSVEELRRLVAARAAEAGLPAGRIVHLSVAVNEIAANSLRHGGGSGVLRTWSDGSRIVCEICDGGRLRDPLADRRLPSLDAGGRGLWIASQLCDLVQVRSSDAGTVVRLQMCVE